AVGMMGFGEESGRWRLRLSDAAEASRIHLSLKRASSGTTVVVVRGAGEAVAVMASEDWIKAEDAMVLLQMDVGASASIRSPGGKLGRGLRSSRRREVEWTEISDSVASIEELMDRFETGAGL
ncbi:hypothetical protein AB4Y88_19290, partial [Paenarthrobacter sp. RAF9]